MRKDSHDLTQNALTSMPPFAPASMRLVELLSQDDAVVEQVAALLRLDADVIAEILRLANSPTFGFERQIRDLAHAIVMLGTRRVKALIATVELKQSSHGGGGMQGYWRHSVAAGLLASELASSRAVSPDDAYTAGLLHELVTRESVAGLPSPPPGLGEVVGLACRLSNALGFSMAGHEAGGATLESLLLQLPKTAAVRIDPSRTARALEEKIAYINN
jgi:hypothetical protein